MWKMNSQSDTAVDKFAVYISSTDTEHKIFIHSNEMKATLTLDYIKRYNISVAAINCAGESRADDISFIKCIIICE